MPRSLHPPDPPRSPTARLGLTRRTALSDIIARPSPVSKGLDRNRAIFYFKDFEIFPVPAGACSVTTSPSRALINALAMERS